MVVKSMKSAFVAVGYPFCLEAFRKPQKKNDPYGLPFCGSFFTMILLQSDFRNKLLPKYGDLVTYNLFNIKFYKINDIELTKHVFKLADCRPTTMRKAYEKINGELAFGILNKDDNLHLQLIQT